MTSLPDLLAAALLAWLEMPPDGAPRRVLLWLDPEGQFKRLAAHLGPALIARNAQLLQHAASEDGGQLHLKLALLRLEADASAKVVVYLPGYALQALQPRADGQAPVLWSVYDYRFKGCVWGRGQRYEPGSIPEPLTLLAWLQRHGLKIVDAATSRALTRGGTDSLLARYAERRRDSLPSRWPVPLRLSDVEQALGGDPRDALRHLIAHPANEVKRWGSERAVVLSRIKQEYGMALPGDGDADAVADAAAVSLALTEAWEAFGRPADFPFVARLPAAPEQRERQIAFLRGDVLPNADLRPRFLERMRRLERDYALEAWAKGRDGQPRGLPRLARARWRRFIHGLEAAVQHGKEAAPDYLRAESETIREAAAVPWSAADEPQWPLARDLHDLVVDAQAAVQEALACQDVAALVARYTGSWWRIDRLHLRILAGADEAHLATIRSLADRAYLEYAARLADRFTELAEREGRWPPAGTTGVAALQKELWGAGGRRQAVLLIDACRWDIGASVRGLLRGDDCTLEPVIAVLPTDTAFGMAALLPLQDGLVAVDFGAAGRPAIRKLDAPGAAATARLDTRDGRKAFLRAVLVDAQGKPSIDFLDLADLLNGAKLPTAPLLAVFDNELDEQAHKGPEQFPGLVERFVQRYKRSIDLLHDAGFEVVHLVTDHGFLFLPPHLVDTLGDPQVPVSQVHYRDYRWAALKPGAPAQDVMRWPLTLAPQIELGIPRGVRTLTKADAHLHGGMSLQECVLPHLVSRRSLPQARIGLDLSVSTKELTGGTVPVILRPAAPEPQAPLGGLQPITVKVWVETVPPPGGAPVIVAGPEAVLLRPDAKEIIPPLYFRDGCRLEAGQQLRLRASDSETEQELGSIDLTLVVDWD